MPELPEVEVLRLSLERTVLGERFEKVHVRNGALREPVDRAALRRRLTGRAIRSLRRRAKYLLIDVEGGSTLVVHLGMSGRLTVERRSAPRLDHEHLVFELASSSEPRELRFRDPRRFGLVLALPTDGLDDDRHFRHLGIEPLSRQSHSSESLSSESLSCELDGDYLSRRAQGRTAPVKAFLTDAGVVVGVGNIYASEALYRAGIHPRRSVSRISRERFARLADEVRAVLGDAIEQGGTTLNDFANSDGEPGYFAVSLAAYGREGQACARCGSAIRRIVQSNRSTFYCPRCQR